ncbi:MAG: TIGR00341 family protein [Limimaricola sp.]|uniref:TIGR00341 family protein n=1 Tax=Limimaricola sp. TaxID=2211665 RepID=UPI001E190D5C|nr:TIGR00341 family protein [Limimaricola sp.]MBI1417479.1 TIGR00341 family protein [Limimaricola sp.]
MDERLILFNGPREIVETARDRIDPDKVLSMQTMTGGRGIRSLQIVVDKANRQEVVDALQVGLGKKKDWSLTILQSEVVLPAREEASSARDLIAETGQTREELLAEVTRAARLDQNYLAMVVLSTIVAAIGLLSDNIAVVIGAMVIAPLLGPILAFALAVALGDLGLMRRAFLVNGAGVGLTLILCVLIGLGLGTLPTSHEVMARTAVGLDGVALALASGAAAALSLLAGSSGVLVGVMVAVALLPPAAAMGLTLGAGQWNAAVGASLLLAVNVVSVTLAAQAVFVLRKITPRTWYRQQAARRAVRINLAGWAVLLAALVAILWTRQPGF